MQRWTELLLHWSPLVRLSCGTYEAWISPGAGGRLCRLIWHGPNGDRNLVVPVDTDLPFDQDAWPKQGAFPMLPYTNRLKEGRFQWGGNDYRIRVVPGQRYGLHGFGHRQTWQVDESNERHISMSWRHTADTVEWPWSFTARLVYSLSDDGFEMDLMIRNESTTSMPAILGWHPYVPAFWLTAANASGMACAVHALDDDGACVADMGLVRPIRIVTDDQTPHTVALQDWRSNWSIQTLAGERWCLTANVAHLVHHVPKELTYACIEPVSALPGSLGLTSSQRVPNEMGLAPATWRRLKCRLEATDLGKHQKTISSP